MGNWTDKYKISKRRIGCKDEACGAIFPESAIHLGPPVPPFGLDNGNFMFVKDDDFTVSDYPPPADSLVMCCPVCFLEHVNGFRSVQGRW